MLIFCLFCFVGFSHSLPFLDFLQEEEDSSETVLIPTRHNTTDTTHRCNKTLEFGKTHTCRHLQNLCYYTSGDVSFLPFQTINPQRDLTESTKVPAGSFCSISEFYYPGTNTSLQMWVSLEPLSSSQFPRGVVNSRRSKCLRTQLDRPANNQSDDTWCSAEQRKQKTACRDELRWRSVSMSVSECGCFAIRILKYFNRKFHTSCSHLVFLIWKCLSGAPRH